MIEPSQVTSIGTAFVAGLITSLHCVGMCGPMACVFLPRPGSGGSVFGTTTVYHLTRVAGYGIIGAILGWFGQTAIDRFSTSLWHYMPWLTVLFFLLVAFRVDHWLPRPRWITRTVMNGVNRLRDLPAMATASVLGAATPFLPCGPLYLVFGLAMVSGSAVRGAEFLVAFGLGTLPLLFIVHSQYGRLRLRWSPLTLSRVQRSMALAMAVLVVWRLSGPTGVVGPEATCPLCP